MSGPFINLPDSIDKMKQDVVAKIMQNEAEQIEVSRANTQNMVELFPAIASQLWGMHRDACAHLDRYCPELPRELNDHRIKKFYGEKLLLIEPYLPEEISIVEAHDEFCAQVDAINRETEARKREIDNIVQETKNEIDGILQEAKGEMLDIIIDDRIGTLQPRMNDGHQPHIEAIDVGCFTF